MFIKINNRIISLNKIKGISAVTKSNRKEKEGKFCFLIKYFDEPLAEFFEYYTEEEAIKDYKAIENKLHVQ